MPVSVPLTDVTVHTDRRGFVRLGALLVLVGLVCLPALVVYGAAFVDYPLVTTVGIPATVARVGSLAVTLLLASGVAVLAYRRAIDSYNRYTLP